MKAIKNDTEIANLHQANIYDGLAVTKLMYWLQNDKTNKTEMSVVEKLHELRMQQPLYIEDSFSTIAAFGPNGAMMHYNPATGNNAKIKDGFLLVDSGGQYYTGTTDITRTFVMGKISKEMQEDFTRALSGHLALAKVRFMEGLAGYNLDILARQPMWEAGLDYKCGTGHGVGYLSNVHEGPQGFRYKIVPERTDNASLQINMVTTIEPGIYKEGYYGIRHENDVVCVDAGTTPDGHFLAFEPLTLCPFDRNGIIPEMLPASERTYLNNYHQLVYRQLSPLMNEQEKAWLQKVTAAI
jgi:Xaa-Pro aminopeptidase